MTNKNEENFRKALKTLVMDEPQKLAFFDGLTTDAAIPPFVPTEENPERKMNAARRRKYNLGMIAAVACSFAFVCAAAINYSPGFTSPMIGGAGGAIEKAMPAPAEDSAIQPETTGKTVEDTEAFSYNTAEEEEESSLLEPNTEDESAVDATPAASKTPESADDSNTSIEFEKGADTDSFTESEPNAEVSDEAESPSEPLPAGAANMDAGDKTISNAMQTPPLPLLLLGAIISAAVFIILLLNKRKTSR